MHTFARASPSACLLSVFSSISFLHSFYSANLTHRTYIARSEHIFSHKSRHHLVSFLVSSLPFRSRNLLNYLLFALNVYAQVVAKFWFGVVFSGSLSLSPSLVYWSLYTLSMPSSPYLSRARDRPILSLCARLQCCRVWCAAPPRPTQGRTQPARSPLEPLHGFVACFAICNACARAAN